MFVSGWNGLLMGVLVGVGACVDACMRALVWAPERARMRERMPAWQSRLVLALNGIAHVLRWALKDALKDVMGWSLAAAGNGRSYVHPMSACIPAMLLIMGFTVAGCQPPPLASEMSLGNVRLARYLSLTCDGSLPKAPSGMTIARLHDCEAIAGLRSQYADPDSTLSGLVSELEQWVILTRTCSSNDANCFITQAQLIELKNKGFVDIEDEFRTTSSGRTSLRDRAIKPQKSGVRAGQKSTGQQQVMSNLSNWHSLQTGARIVVPELLSQLQQKATSASTPVYAPRLKVAVLDSGIDAVALSNRVDTTRISTITHTSAMAVSTSTWSAPSMCVSGILSCGLQDELGHGTSVADLILAASGGMAEPISVRVLNSEGAGLASGVTTGLIVAVGRFQAPVINMSLGIQVDGMPKYLATALRVLRGFGVRVFAAAGNRNELLVDDAPLYQPAAGGSFSASEPYAARTVSVSGVGVSGAVSEQVLEKMELVDPSLFAPSEHICSRTADGARKSSFIAPSGTSFAVAQMSGAMALMMSVQQVSQGPGRDLFNAYGSITRLETALINDQRRLDYCSAVDALNLTIDRCVSWQPSVAIDSDECIEPTTGGASVDLNTATPSAVQSESGGGVGTILSAAGWLEASDQGVEPVWGVPVSSLPGQGVCDWCTSYSGCRSTDTGMTLVLGEVPCNFSAFQLRVSNPSALPLYLDIDSAMQKVQDPLCANNASVSTRVDISTEISFAAGTVQPEATLFLVARDEANLWSGRPVMRTCE